MKSSYATLTDSTGNFLQIAGGPGLFLLERREDTGKHFRAAQKTPVVPFEDGTILSFSAGKLTLARNEWFLINQVVEILDAFVQDRAFPEALDWTALGDDYRRTD